VKRHGLCAQLLGRGLEQRGRPRRGLRGGGDLLVGRVVEPLDDRVDVATGLFQRRGLGGQLVRPGPQRVRGGADRLGEVTGLPVVGGVGGTGPAAGQRVGTVLDGVRAGGELVGVGAQRLRRRTQCARLAGHLLLVGQQHRPVALQDRRDRAGQVDHRGHVRTSCPSTSTFT